MCGTVSSQETKESYFARSTNEHLCHQFRRILTNSRDLRSTPSCPEPCTEGKPRPSHSHLASQLQNQVTDAEETLTLDGKPPHASVSTP